MTVRNIIDAVVIKYTAYTVVEVNWRTPQYAIREGSSDSICAIQFEPTERAYSVFIQAPTSQGSYTRYNLFYTSQFLFPDYGIEETQLAFLPSAEPQMSCTTVNATSDERLEDTETFAFALENPDEDVVIIGLSSVTTLTIMDETGEHNDVSELSNFQQSIGHCCSCFTELATDTLHCGRRPQCSSMC